MKQHTPEPWAWFETEDGAASCVAEGMAVARCNVHDPFGQDAINARRIAACVNACAGISTEDLEHTKDQGLIRTIRRRVKTEKQRDELLAALRAIATDRNLGSAYIIANDAIASVEGGAE